MFDSFLNTLNSALNQYSKWNLMYSALRKLFIFKFFVAIHIYPLTQVWQWPVFSRKHVKLHCTSNSLTLTELSPNNWYIWSLELFVSNKIKGTFLWSRKQESMLSIGLKESWPFREVEALTQITTYIRHCSTMCWHSLRLNRFGFRVASLRKLNILS